MRRDPSAPQVARDEAGHALEQRDHGKEPHATTPIEGAHRSDDRPVTEAHRHAEERRDAPALPTKAGLLLHRVEDERLTGAPEFAWVVRLVLGSEAEGTSVAG